MITRSVPRQHFGGVRELGEKYVCRIEADVASEQVGERLRLLHYLLEHEVLVAALGKNHVAPGDGGGDAGYLCTALIEVAGAIGLDEGKLTVLQIYRGPGVG